MPFGLASPAPAADFADICKYDANAGRLFRVDYSIDSREKESVDITIPPPRFAVDFGSLEVGYAHFASGGPEFRLVPEGKPLPVQPTDLDEKGRLKFRPVFRLKIYGKIVGGLREWSSAANCVLEPVDDLYAKFKAAPEAQQGKIPICELTKTIPVTVGRGTRQRTLYAPCFTITGWTDRVAAMGERTVPIPNPPAQALPPEAETTGSSDNGIDDEIPF